MLAFLCAAAMTQDISKLIHKFEPEKKPKLLIVGFYHFANPGKDLVKADLDDHLSTKRQTEIAALNAKLATFNPTKITIEEPFLNTETQERYEEFINGKHQLTVNESEQIGFRLAKQLNLKTIFPIDTKLDMDFDTFMQNAPKKDVEQVQKMMVEMQTYMATLKDHTVGENLRSFNSKEADRLTNGIYLKMLSAIDKDQHIGAELVSSWWKRNLMWVANLTTVATDPNDRVLVICGSGHASLIRSILRDSIDFEIVDTLKYLP